MTTATATPAASPSVNLRNYVLVTGAYWADTLTDGALCVEAEPSRRLNRGHLLRQQLELPLVEDATIAHFSVVRPYCI